MKRWAATAVASPGTDATYRMSDSAGRQQKPAYTVVTDSRPIIMIPLPDLDDPTN